MYSICIIKTWTFTVVWLRVRFTENNNTRLNSQGQEFINI